MDRGEWDKATTDTQRCLATLDDFFKAHPKQQNTAFEIGDAKVTYTTARAACTKQLADIAQAQKAASGERAAHGKEQLAALADANYTRMTEQLAEARSEVKSGKYNDALGDFDGAISGIETLTNNFGEILDKDSSLATFQVQAGKAKVTAKKLVDDLTALDAKVKKEREAIVAKAEKQADAADDLAVKLLKGDRKRVFDDAGWPTWYEGANIMVTNQRVHAFVTAAAWRYENSDGCKTTYHFSGNKLKRTERHGCD
jgi:hypothetical protein